MHAAIECKKGTQTCVKPLVLNLLWLKERQLVSGIVSLCIRQYCLSFSSEIKLNTINMQRDELEEMLLKRKALNNLLILPTGYGKSRLAIKLLQENNCKNVLIVIPKLVLIDTWTEELKKWKYEGVAMFSTYVSISKRGGESFDAVIYDEAHHITDRVADVIPTINARCSTLLSATVKRDKIYLYKQLFPNLAVTRSSLKEAIDDGVLPTPKIILIPLNLTTEPDEIVIRKTHVRAVNGTYGQLYGLNKMYPKNRINISCNQIQKNLYYEREIDMWKRRYIATQQIYLKNKWLRLAGEKLKWLSSIKEKYILEIQEKLKNFRTITFCSSIAQTERLGKNMINSKNEKKSAEILESFNEGAIDHITSCDMLNEGVNLVACQIGIFAALNSSETMQIQKLGRLLRHDNPCIVVPYYSNTRDAEIVTSMFEGQNTVSMSLEDFLKSEDYGKN